MLNREANLLKSQITDRIGSHVSYLMTLAGFLSAQNLWLGESATSFKINTLSASNVAIKEVQKVLSADDAKLKKHLAKKANVHELKKIL